MCGFEMFFKLLHMVVYVWAHILVNVYACQAKTSYFVYSIMIHFCWIFRVFFLLHLLHFIFILSTVVEFYLNIFQNQIRFPHIKVTKAIWVNQTKFLKQNFFMIHKKKTHAKFSDRSLSGYVFHTKIKDLRYSLCLCLFHLYNNNKIVENYNKT